MSNTGISTTLTGRSAVDAVTLIYTELLGRTPEDGGLSYYADQIVNGGLSITNLARSIIASPEYTAAHAGMTPGQQIDADYVNVLGRHASDAEQAYWASGPLANAAVSIASSQEAASHNDNGLHRFETLAINGQVSSSSHLDNSPLQTQTSYPVYVPTEPAHATDALKVGTLDVTSTLNFDGQHTVFGTGNSAQHFLFTVDHTSNVEFGLEDHYRGGDYVDPVLSGSAWKATMDPGIQNGLHNEPGVNATRSGASVDLSMNFGTGQPTDGKFVLTVGQVGGASQNFTLGHSGANWFFADSTNTPVQGLTLSADGHVLQDSTNLGFGFYSYLPHGPAGSGDIKPGDYTVTLTEMVGTTGAAAVTETLHLV